MSPSARPPACEVQARRELRNSYTTALPRRGARRIHGRQPGALRQSPDHRLFEVCSQESRCLVTLDIDFGDVTRFPPSRSAGIVVLRLPRNPTLPILESLVDTFLRSIGDRLLAGRPWMVEPGRIRVHQTEAELNLPE
jgi:predicted nuclease of predicted toxin-antitoxin system